MQTANIDKCEIADNADEDEPGLSCPQHDNTVLPVLPRGIYDELLSTSSSDPK